MFYLRYNRKTKKLEWVTRRPANAICTMSEYELAELEIELAKALIFIGKKA